ncbi:MAG: translation initiation factor Sui1 [Pseudomonadales bacterium]|jgi:translation initiation factor 1|nr:translation initiation factor Sui1 [Pseudomonadales bacterium]
MSNSRSVYSTDQGRLCPGCGKPVAACVCRQRSAAPLHKGDGNKGDGIVRIHRETKGRGGKGVSLIKGLPLDAEALKQLAAKLKQHCGTGGTVKDGVIEIQGDQRDKLSAYLQQQGYNVKLAGG